MNKITQLPKLFVTDIDGVWTDGGMYYTERGDEFKKFNVRDGAGVALLNMLEIPWAIITGENSQAVVRRGEKLKCPYVNIAVKNKVRVLEAITNELGCRMSEVVYIGDEINDFPLLETDVFFICPSDAAQVIKDRADLVLDVAGGHGVFRKAVELVLIHTGHHDEALQRFTDHLTNAKS